MKIESAPAVKRTAETIRYGDDLMYAIEMADEWREEVDQYSLQMEIYDKGQGAKPERPKPNIHFLGRTVFDHILLKVKQIRSSDLESTMKFLNYSHACSLLFYTEHYLRNNTEIELATRIALFLMKAYQTQLQQQSEMHQILASMNIHMKHYFKEHKRVIGKNLCALQLTSK